MNEGSNTGGRRVAPKKPRRVLRYILRTLLAILSVAAVLVVIAVTGVMEPLVFFLGYMSLKVTAYLQPITHKLCNKLFHEVDPEPVPEEELAAQEGEIPAEQ